MPEVKWIKITTAMFDDEKIRLIEALPEADTVLIIWVKLLCLAGKTNASGYIFLSERMPYNEEMLATIFNRPLNTVRLALATFQRFGMIEVNEQGIYLVNWQKHQSTDKLEQIREQGRLRKQAERQRKMLPAGDVAQNTPNNGHAYVTPMSRDSHVTVTPMSHDCHAYVTPTSRDSHVTVTRRHATEQEQDIDKDKDNNNNPREIQGGIDEDVVVVLAASPQDRGTESLSTETEIDDLVAMYSRVTGLDDLRPGFLAGLMREAGVRSEYVREKLLLLDSPKIKATLPFFVAAVKNNWRPAQPKQKKADKPGNSYKSNPGCPDCGGAGWRIVTNNKGAEYAEPCPCQAPAAARDRGR